jgi:hypothetical protein
MRSDSLIRLGASRAFRSLVLVATLFLGATFHEWHHALDPHCDGDSHSSQHACGCAVMHAAALVEAEQHAPAPARLDWTAFAPAAVAPAAFPAPALAAPRAPPAS